MDKPIYSGKFKIGGWLDSDGNSVSKEVEKELNKLLDIGDKPNEDTVEIPYTTEALEPTCISVDGGTIPTLWMDGDDGSIVCLICGCEMWESDLIDGKANYCPNCGTRMKPKPNP